MSVVFAPLAVVIGALALLVTGAKWFWEAVSETSKPLYNAFVKQIERVL